MNLKGCVVFLALFLALLLPMVSEAGVSIVGGLSREKSVEIGKDYPGIIFIRNNDEEPQAIKVYQTDYLFFFDGTNIYGESAGKDPRSNANWITFSPQRLTIPAKGISGVNYNVKVPNKVPNDETLMGTYWSMMMVEGIGKSAPEAISPEEGKVKVGIRQIIRYGIQMVTHIGNTGSRKLEFLEKTKLLRENGKRILQIDVGNTGERWLKPFLWAELYDEEGRYIGRFEGGRLRTYPGTSVRFRVDLSEVPKGTYKSLVVADCGGDDIFGMTYTLKFQK